MAFETEIVSDLAIILVAAGLVAFIFSRLRQPLVLGFIIAGIIVGPFTPPFSLVSRLDFLHALANLGVILLLFGLGLEFPVAKLKGLGAKIIGISLIEIGAMFAVSYILGIVLGLSTLESLFLGTALASSSTAIIVKSLTDMGKLHDLNASLMLGILIVEDLCVIILLAALQSYSSLGSFDIAPVGWEIAKIVLFIGGTLGIGKFIIPRLIDWLAATREPEILMITTVGLAFGFAYLGSSLGFSYAIGAFMMGVLMASSRAIKAVRRVTAYPRDIFGAIFFVSVGALIDIGQFSTFLIPAALITLGMVLGKVLGIGAGTRLFGYGRHTALLVGLGMAQIGEFAFIVMQSGMTQGIIGQDLYSAIAIAVLITTFTTPYLLRFGYRRMKKQLTASQS